MLCIVTDTVASAAGMTKLAVSVSYAAAPIAAAGPVEPPGVTIPPELTEVPGEAFGAAPKLVTVMCVESGTLDTE